MPKRAPPLSVKGLEALTSEGQAQRDVADGFVPGLGVRVSKTGRKTWLVSYVAPGGKNRRMKIGTFPGMSLADARTKAREVLTRVDNDEDPARDRDDRRKGRYSFEEMAREIVDGELAERLKNDDLRESTHREWKRILESELIPAWGDIPASEITRRDVRKLTEGIVARGSPAMASRVLSFVKFLFNRGLDRDFPKLETNPAHRMKPPVAEGGRDRYLTADEIKAVWKATGPDIPGVGNAFRLALLTAQRMGSIAAMRWEDITEEAAGWIWTVPPEHFKGKRPHLVPLAPEALEIIEEMRKTPASKVWVFPSRPGSKEPYLQAWNKSLQRIRARTDIPSWVAHDFRTTFRTHAVRAVEDGGLGVLPPVADQVLGHAEQSLGFQRYQGDRDRYLLSEKREALVRWGAFVRKTIQTDGGGDV